MNVKPFKAWRPATEKAPRVASVPYDVVTTQQATALAHGNPDSFLHVVRAEIDFPAGTDLYSDAVYEKARENLQRMMCDGTLIREKNDYFYLYRQQMGAHAQCGIVATCHLEDYESGRIKIHEETRKLKQRDRTRYVDQLNANTGPVFLAFKDSPAIAQQIDQTTRDKPLYQFTSDDGITHTVWTVEPTAAIERALADIPAAYVADGHHRCASAAHVGATRRAANAHHTGHEAYNRFLAVLFPASHLQVLPYNRTVSDLNGRTNSQFLDALRGAFQVKASSKKEPGRAGLLCMYLDHTWFELSPLAPRPDDPVGALDVSVLQDRILAPLLGIDNPRESERLGFVGGVYGTAALEHCVDAGDARAAFSLHPTTLAELMAVADAQRLMPPKSTWFEPKLRSGLFVNTLD